MKGPVTSHEPAKVRPMCPRCAGGSQGQDRWWGQEEGGWHRWVLQNWERIPVSCSAERSIPEAFLFWTLSETRRLETDPSSRAPSKLQAPPEQSFLPLSWPPCEGWPLSAVGPGRTGRPLSRSSPVCDVTVAPDAPPCVPVCMASVVGVFDALIPGVFSLFSEGIFYLHLCF